MGKILKTGKKLMFSLLCLILLSCAHQESVTPGACGSCGVSKSSTFQPEDAIKSMVLITGTAIQGDKELGQWWGSGAVVGHNEKMGSGGSGRGGWQERVRLCRVASGGMGRASWGEMRWEEVGKLHNPIWPTPLPTLAFHIST